MLFLLVGVIYDRAHHREINGFGGLASIMPLYTASPGSRSSPRWGSRGCRRSSPRCWCCSARGAAIRSPATERRGRGERGRADGGLHAVGAAAHVPREAEREVPDAPGHDGARARPRSCRSRAIVIFLGVYPAPILNLQSPRAAAPERPGHASPPRRPATWSRPRRRRRATADRMGADREPGAGSCPSWCWWRAILLVVFFDLGITVGAGTAHGVAREPGADRRRRGAGARPSGCRRWACGSARRPDRRGSSTAWWCSTASASSSRCCSGWRCSPPSGCR